MQSKRQKVAENLYLKAFADGREYYVVRYMQGGRQREKSLGSTKGLTLKQAKLKAAVVMSQAPEERRASPETFADILEPAIADIKRLKQWRNSKSEAQWRSTLTTYALPYIGRKSVASITRDDIVEVLRPIWETKTDTASKVLQRLSSIFSWAIVRGLRAESNPAAWKGNLEYFFPARGRVHKVEHHDAPTVDELRKVVAYCRAHPSAGSGIILFVIGTVCRVSEARLLDAEQIVGGTWMVPAEIQKTEEEGRRVPLSRLAREGLAMGAQEGVVFRGLGGGRLAVDTPRQKLQMILGRKTTVHGIRSTFRDWAARSGIQDAVAEKCLSHVWGSEVTRAYYRTDLYEERKAALEKWAACLLQRPAGGCKV